MPPGSSLLGHAIIRGAGPGFLERRAHKSDFPEGNIKGFDANSHKLKGTDWPILQVLADLLKKDPALNVQIAGHTDSTGDAAANQSLSERRANA